MPFGFSDTFEVTPVKPPDAKPSPWLSEPLLFEPDNTAPVPDAHKKAFAIEWAKVPTDPFKAALQVFPEDTTSALWASRNWILEPDVNAIKDQYLKSLKEHEKLLDREETARKFLSFCDEKDKSGRYTIEARDRLKALEYYAKMMGYMEESVIKNVINNDTTVNNNEMKIVFVEPDAKMIEKISAIESKPANESKILDAEDIEAELGIKLVG